MAGKKTIKKTKKKVAKKTTKKPLHKVNVVDGMKVVYAVEWIEVEWGQRSEGYRLFLDEKDCIASTKKSSERGPYPSGGGYLGPVRPLVYVEVPFDSLEPEYKKQLKKTGSCHTENRWRPKFKGTRKSI
jgi:hypothetical protein